MVLLLGREGLSQWKEVFIWAARRWGYPSGLLGGCGPFALASAERMRRISKWGSCSRRTGKHMPSKFHGGSYQVWSDGAMTRNHVFVFRFQIVVCRDLTKLHIHRLSRLWCTTGRRTRGSDYIERIFGRPPQIKSNYSTQNFPWLALYDTFLNSSHRARWFHSHGSRITFRTKKRLFGSIPFSYITNFLILACTLFACIIKSSLAVNSKSLAVLSAIKTIDNP